MDQTDCNLNLTTPLCSTTSTPRSTSDETRKTLAISPKLKQHNVRINRASLKTISFPSKNQMIELDVIRRLSISQQNESGPSSSSQPKIQAKNPGIFKKISRKKQNKTVPHSSARSRHGSESSISNNGFINRNRCICCALSLVASIALTLLVNFLITKFSESQSSNNSNTSSTNQVIPNLAPSNPNDLDGNTPSYDSPPTNNPGAASRVSINALNCGKLHPSVANLYESGQQTTKNQTEDQVGRIVGGSYALIQQHPWQVSLWTRGSHTCGGSIIASSWILFAAHCVVPFPKTNDWSVYAGQTDQSSLFTHGQFARVIRIISHPSFDEDTFNNDLALLQLDRHLSMTPYVNTVCLPKTPDLLVYNTICKISGWGAIYEGASAASNLRSVDVKIIDTNVCNAPEWLFGLVTNFMFCAGSEDGSKDACQGDSGGPLTCNAPSAAQSIVLGAVSWGIGCGVPKAPGVYTHLGHYYAWIVQQTIIFK